jgi:endonuclease/exonuclease/phosphatase family metal-dependent hydrolase
MKKQLILLSILTLWIVSSQAQDTLQVMTYNIRNSNANDGVNKWNKRKQRLFDLIHKYNPDILGMQEVLQLQLKHLNTALNEYDHVGVGRNDGKTKGEYSPIFYKRDRYKLITYATIWLSETPDVPGSKSWDAAITRIATWAALRNKKTGDTIYVFNTHFDHKGTKARENSATLLINTVQKLVGKHAYVICGDFNMRDNSPAYYNLTHGAVSAIDSYVEAPPADGEKNTDYGFEVANKEGARIDYIFHSRSYKTIATQVIKDNNRIYYPSDHLAYRATLLKH